MPSDTNSLTLIFIIATFIVAVIALLVAIIGIVIQHRTERSQWQIAKETGALGKPNLGLAVFNGFLLGEGYPDNEHWCFIRPGERDDLVLFPIRFTIYNNGDATADGIVMTIDVNRFCFPPTALESMTVTAHPRFLADSIKLSADPSGKFTRLTLALPGLEPRLIDVFEIPFSFEPTFIESRIKTKTKDDVPFSFTAKGSFAYKLTVYLASHNSIPLKFEIFVRAIPATDMKDGVKKYSAFQGESEDSKPHRPLVKRILDSFTFYLEPQVVNLLAFDLERKTSTKDGVLYEMKLPQTVYRRVLLHRDIDNSETIDSGRVLSIVNFKLIPRSERRPRKQEGNAVREI